MAPQAPQEDQEQQRRARGRSGGHGECVFVLSVLLRFVVWVRARSGLGCGWIEGKGSGVCVPKMGVIG